MAKGAKLFEIIYVDTQERAPVLVGIGDTIRAADWAEGEYPFPQKPDLRDGLTAAELDFNREEYRIERAEIDAKRENRASLYAIFLGAERAKMRGSELGWVEWLSLVTMPVDDDEDEEEIAQGESAGPPSGC